jgi:hypothetical protein
MLPDLSIIKIRESLDFFSFLGGSPPTILTGRISSILVSVYPPSAVILVPHCHYKSAAMILYVFFYQHHLLIAYIISGDIREDSSCHI